MSAKPRRGKAESEYGQIIDEFRPLAQRTLTAVAVSRFILALIPIQLKYLLDPLLKVRDVTVMGYVIDPVLLLAVLVSTGLLIAAVRGIADYVVVSTAGRHGHGLVARLRVLMYEHILRVPSGYARRRGTGKILLRFIGDSDALRSWYSRRRQEVIVDRLLLGILIVVMVVVDWRLSLVVLIPLPAVILAARKIAPQLAGETLQARFEQARLSGAIGHQFDFIHQAKWLDRHSENRAGVHRQAEHVARLNAGRDARAAALQGIGQFFAFTSVPLLLLAGVLLSWRNMIELGQCMAFVWLTAHLAVTIHRLNAAVVIREKAMVSKERILKLLERTAERGRSSHAGSIVPRGQSISVQAVEFGRGHRIHPGSDAATLQLRGHGMHAVADWLLRPLVLAILGLEKTTSGSIEIDDQQLSKLNIASVRRTVGWIMDEPMIVSGTVAENICLADPQMTPDQINDFVQTTFDRNAKQWLETESGINGQLLSDRDVLDIAIARALISGPSFVFVDLKYLNEETAIHLARVLSQFSHQCMVLIPRSLFHSIERHLGDADTDSRTTLALAEETVSC